MSEEVVEDVNEPGRNPSTSFGAVSEEMVEVERIPGTNPSTLTGAASEEIVEVVPGRNPSTSFGAVSDKEVTQITEMEVGDLEKCTRSIEEVGVISPNLELQLLGLLTT